jgi:hypothetical protein
MLTILSLSKGEWRFTKQSLRKKPALWRSKPRTLQGVAMNLSVFFSLASINQQTEGGMTMRRLWMLVFFFIIFLLGNAPEAVAQFSEAGVQKLRVAVDAPDFTLKELSGGKISLKELRGKVILLNFFATW